MSDETSTIVTHVIDVGEDRLHILGVRGHQVLEAFGWVSALRNHFEPGHYLEPDESGNVHIHPDAQPREMTPDEAVAYGRRLLEEQNPRPQVDVLGHRDAEADDALARVASTREALEHHAEDVRKTQEDQVATELRDAADNPITRVKRAAGRLVKRVGGK